MFSNKTPFIVLMADDDEDDRLLAHEALLESHSNIDMRFVRDGVELMQYLRGEGDYCDRPDLPRPNLILLDLNMPRKDGREVLAELKSDPKLADIPVIILTTSSTEQDVLRGSKLGAASYRTKPVTFNAMVDFMRSLDSLIFSSGSDNDLITHLNGIYDESGLFKT
jgi:CheY-like chemotaxis protein